MEWKEIQEFDSPDHFQSFRARIESALSDGSLVRVPVTTPYASLMFHEEWYRSGSGDVWRLVEPDFPFKGIFERVPGGVGEIVR